MKRILLLILVLFFLADLADDGQVGKPKYCLGHSPVKITVTSTDQNPGPGHIDLHHDPASLKVPGKPFSSSFQPTTLHLSPTLQIMHCCHLSSAGGNPR